MHGNQFLSFARINVIEAVVAAANIIAVIPIL